MCISGEIEPVRVQMQKKKEKNYYKYSKIGEANENNHFKDDRIRAWNIKLDDILDPAKVSFNMNVSDGCFQINKNCFIASYMEDFYIEGNMIPHGNLDLNRKRKSTTDIIYMCVWVCVCTKQ